MNWLAIIAGLEKYVTDIDCGLKVNQPSVKVNPGPGVPYIELVHVPVDTEPITIGSAGVMNTKGIMVLGLNYPSGEGGGAAYSKADALAKFFKPGQSIPAGSGNIVINKATLGTKQPSSKADWWSLPLVIHYDALHNY